MFLFTPLHVIFFQLDSPFKFRRGLYSIFFELLSLENPLHAQKRNRGQKCMQKYYSSNLQKLETKNAHLHNCSIRIVLPVSCSTPLQRKTCVIMVNWPKVNLPRTKIELNFLLEFLAGSSLGEFSFPCTKLHSNMFARCNTSLSWN